MTKEEIEALQQQAQQQQAETARRAAEEAAKVKEGPQYQFDVGVTETTRPTLPTTDTRLTRPPNFTQPTTPVVVQGILPGGGGDENNPDTTPAPTITAPITTTESNLQPVQQVPAPSNPLAREGTTVPQTDLKTAQPQTTQTPYGPVTVTRPVGAPAVPNALAKERVLLDLASTSTGKTAGDLQQNLEASAKNYRALVAANASPEQRAAAKQQYADALESKAVAVRETGREPTSASQAFGAPQQVVSPAEQQRIAHYNDMAKSMGVNPYQIGTAEMNAKGGLNVLPIREETAINTMADKAAKQYRDLQRIEHDARQAYKEAQQGKGKRTEGQTAREEAAKTRLMEAQQAMTEYGLKSGAVDPSNPTAGANIDNIRRTVTAARALGRDPSSLSGLAQQQITQKATGQKEEEPKKEPTQADRQVKEMAEITARNKAANEEWYRELERRKQAALGQAQYAYNY